MKRDLLSAFKLNRSVWPTHADGERAYPDAAGASFKWIRQKEIYKFFFREKGSGVNLHNTPYGNFKSPIRST